MIDRRLVVIGAGPAGLSAAIEAAKTGCQVLLIDENARPGGQLFKQIHKFFGSRAHHAGTRGYYIGTELLEETQKLGIEVWLNSEVCGIDNGNEIWIVRDKKNMCAFGQKKSLLLLVRQKTLLPSLAGIFLV